METLTTDGLTTDGNCESPRAGDMRPTDHIASATVSVVVPALNEEGCIGWVLEQIPEWVSEVVLVDGLSVDSTEIVARGLIADLVVVHQSQPGKGAALRAGFAAATGDIIVMLDADGSTDPAELDRFVQALHGGAEFVKGSRHMNGGGSADWTLLRRTGNRAFVAITNLLYGCSFTDLCYGYCAFWRRDVAALQLAADGFEIETELVLNAVRAGLKIREIPSMELPRLAGVSNLHAFRDGRRVLKTIMARRPGRISQRARTRTHLRLHPANVASPGSPGWLPAGNDRRKADRRLHHFAAANHKGLERRGPERRNQPRNAVTVYRAIEQPIELELVPSPSEAPVHGQHGVSDQVLVAEG